MKWVKPRPVEGFFARRLGKYFGKKKKGSKPVSPTELQQAAKFNVTTAAAKGVSPLVSKKAIGVIALITTIAGGWLGKEVMIDEQSIQSAIDNGYQAYIAVMALIGAVTWFYKFVRNIYTEWGRIKTHGVKISGPNADLAFDFAPKNGNDSEG